MKKILLFWVFSVIISCEEKPYFKEIVSEKNVTISMREIDGKKIRILNVPIEFNLLLNPKAINYIGFYYTVNGERAMWGDDFIIFNGDNNKKIYSLEDVKNQNYIPQSIYIMDKRIVLTDEREKELMDKYAPDKKISDLKTKDDTIKLVSYKKFREDFPDFLEKMREIPDTLELSIGFSKGRQEVFGERINW